MVDSFTEVTRTGYGSRLGNSFRGILLGIILIIGSVGLLWWNEGRTVRQKVALNEASENLETISSEKVVMENDNKLVHTEGKVKTKQGVYDNLFGVSVSDLVLKRKVEMYQWDEEQKTETQQNVGGSETKTTTYSYHKKWDEDYIDSQDFYKSGYKNFEMTYKSEEFFAKDAKLGAFSLQRLHLSKIHNFQNFSLDRSQNNLKKVFKNGNISGNNFYSGKIKTPKIGDYRISFSYIPNNTLISIIATQKSNTFIPYKAKNGNEILLIEMGSQTAEIMIQNAQDNNIMWAWIWRCLGLLLLFVGFSKILAPLKVAGSVIPLLGNLVGMATGLISLILALGIGFVIIGISWIYYRPIVGISLLVLSVIGVVLIFVLKKKSVKNMYNTQQESV